MNENKIIDINRKTYLQIVFMLFMLMVVAIAITYVIPKGTFEMTINEFGKEVYDYTKYIKLPEKSGVNIFKGIFSPILVLFSGDGLSLLMLSIFILVIAGAFQIMSDTNGMNMIVYYFIKKFQNNRKLLLAIITFIFMAFGSFFGLFEEVLALLPLIVLLAISLGYDGYTGFLICIVACSFGFASAITNPFTVIAASSIMEVNPMFNLWFRILVFLIMYGLVLAYIFFHVKRIEKNPKSSPTYEKDIKKRELLNGSKERFEPRVFKTFSIFLLTALACIITVTSIKSLRSLTVVFLIFVFLIGGLLSGYICTKNFKNTLKMFYKGVMSALPTILVILMASSIKYILDEGSVLATIANSISSFVEGKNPFVMALMIYFIILFIEFFISSSTAKAVFVMGILSIVNINLSKELIVLLYLFGDGYTNILFPTSPVLLISLSMVGINYFTWLKKGKFLFLINFILVVGLILLAVLVY